MKLLLPFILSIIAMPANQEQSLAELARHVRKAVVNITVYDAAHQQIGSGSGFFIASHGWLVTNFHVIQDASTVTATMSDGKTVAVKGYYAVNRIRDIVILQAIGEDFPYLPLGSSHQAVQGTEVVVVGSPLGLSGSLSAGIVSARRAGNVKPELSHLSDNANPLLQITAAISPGSSGSPVLTRDGAVVGVAVALMKGGQSLNFAVPVEVVQQLLDTIEPEEQPQSFGHRPIHNLLYSLIVFLVVAVVVYMLRLVIARKH